MLESNLGFTQLHDLTSNEEAPELKVRPSLIFASMLSACNLLSHPGMP